MEARSQSAAHPNEMNFIFNLNAFSWKTMQLTMGGPANLSAPQAECPVLLRFLRLLGC